jgi:2-methylcitrate dehydratase
MSEALICDELAAHVVRIRYEHLDAETIAAARWRVLDVLGCGLGGLAAEGNDQLIDWACDTGGKAESTLVGQGGRKVPAGTASMVNAIVARSYDYEVMGVHIEGRVIPSHHAATTVMTALALCEALGRGGRDLLTALVVGDDIAARTLAASGLDFGQGWDGAATYTALGATATAGWLLGLTAEQVRHAWGIVVEQIGGTIQGIWDGAHTFKLGQGTAGRNAVLAAQLALRGWKGMRDPLLGRFAFFAQYTAGCADPGILTRDLGRRFWGEAYFKPYPACMATHVCIEATLQASAGQPVSPDSLEAVHVRLPAAALRNFCAKPFELRAYPHAEAIFSYRHMVACVLLRGGVAQDHYTTVALQEPGLHAIVDRIQVEAGPELDRGAEVEVRWRDGTRRVGRADAPSRSPQVTMATLAEIEDKYRRQALRSGLLDAERADELRERVLTLEREVSVARVCALMAGVAR